MRRTILVLAVLCAAVGCKKKPSAKPATSGAESPAPAEPRRPDISSHPPNIKPTLLPITVDEVKPMIPTFDDARATTELGKAQVGEIVQVAYCFDKGDIAALAELVKEKLTAAGWEGTVTRAVPNAPVGRERDSFSGSHKPYLIFGSIEHGMWVDCSGDKGQTRVSFFVRKQEDTAGEQRSGSVAHPILPGHGARLPPVQPAPAPQSP